ncbi:hypothetical protein PMIN01_07647 [Paraphaeosphaeria minitans]|uniref:Uncharacterized protein n=1 Tax=Paraphaeosphaeria minitans TaxID=565426 RepID=A0A9P6GG16_9PLEO|nr:hypothetical protein PMIN01_07647 [Paraphaeosphaeria minitans]
MSGKGSTPQLHLFNGTISHAPPFPVFSLLLPIPSHAVTSRSQFTQPHPSSPTVVSDHAVGSNSSRINSAPPLPILDHDSLVYLHRPVPTLGLRTPITVSPFARRAGEGNFAVHKPERTGFAGEWNAGWLASRENATLRSNLYVPPQAKGPDVDVDCPQLAGLLAEHRAWLHVFSSLPPRAPMIVSTPTPAVIEGLRVPRDPPKKRRFSRAFPPLAAGPATPLVVHI